MIDDGVRENGRKDEEDRFDGHGGRLKRRLRSVKNRRRARNGFECESVALRVRLVKAEEDSDR